MIRSGPSRVRLVSPERYGGGGHPVVGAISLPPTEAERARAIAAEIRAELSG